MELEWSNKKPCLDGWYWCKSPKGNVIIVYADACEGIIFPNTKIYPEVMAMRYDDFNNGYEFAGPIPLPT